MKRIFVALFLCFCIVLSAVACTPQVSPEETTEKSGVGEQTSINDTEDTTEAESEKLSEVTTEKITDEPTEKVTEAPSETETAEPEVDVADRIAEILNANFEFPVCRVESTLLEMTMSGKVEGQDFYSEMKKEERESIRTVDGMVDRVSVTKQKELMSMSGYSEFSEYTLINGEVGEYTLYGYIPGVSAGGQAIFQKWITEHDEDETNTEESDENIYEDSGLDESSLINIFDEYSLEEETGVYIIEYSEYNGGNEEFVSGLFGDSIAPDMIKDMSLKICINSQSYLPLSVDVDMTLDYSGMTARATARIGYEYYGEDYSILPDNYDDYVLVGDMSYRDVVIEEIEYYFSDLTKFESLCFESIANIALYYTADDSSSEIIVTTYEKDIVNLGYLNDEFVYSIDADMEVMDETQKIKMLYKNGVFSMYLDGELSASQAVDIGSATAILDNAYYDKMIFEKYEITDIEVTNDPEGRKTVVLKSNYSDRIKDAIENLGFDEYELINVEQEYTVVLDEDNYLLVLEYKINAEFKDLDGVTYYIESMSVVGILGEADFSALNVNLPSIGV